jgi:hypothetical protein
MISRYAAGSWAMARLTKSASGEAGSVRADMFSARSGMGVLPAIRCAVVKIVPEKGFGSPQPVPAESEVQIHSRLAAWIATTPILMPALCGAALFWIEPLSPSTSHSLRPAAKKERAMNDLIFLAAGLGLIGLMALYAHSLTRA